MRRYETRNRYNDTVVFEEVEEDHFTFNVYDQKGVSSKYWRFGGRGDTLFADPSGGPFIQKGFNFKEYDNTLPSLEVTYITVGRMGEIILATKKVSFKKKENENR